MVDKRGVVRRVYRNVEYQKELNGYSVLLDNKYLKTPKVSIYIFEIKKVCIFLSLFR